MEVDPKLLRGLSVYQDIVLAGQTVRHGQRDCQARWRLLSPRLPTSGAVLDVGSNFGWFGLQTCQAFPQCVVASVEADLRTAAVQRQVLQSHDHARICLLTRPASTLALREMTAFGQRFQAAILLSVLHWIPDHRDFMLALGDLCGRIFIEHPAPDEAGAGSEVARREIGPIGDYLAATFPDRRAERLGEVASHLSKKPREIWMVEGAGPNSQAADLNVSALLQWQLSWPPRHWWLAQMEGSPQPPTDGVWRLTPAGLRVDACRRHAAGALSFDELRRALRRLPENRLLPWPQLLYRQTRRRAGDLLRRLGLRRG